MAPARTPRRAHHQRTQPVTGSAILEFLDGESRGTTIFPPANQEARFIYSHSSLSSVPPNPDGGKGTNQATPRPSRPRLVARGPSPRRRRGQGRGGLRPVSAMAALGRSPFLREWRRSPARAGAAGLRRRDGSPGRGLGLRGRLIPGTPGPLRLGGPGRRGSSVASLGAAAASRLRATRRLRGCAYEGLEESQGCHGAFA